MIAEKHKAFFSIPMRQNSNAEPQFHCDGPGQPSIILGFSSI